MRPVIARLRYILTIALALLGTGLAAPVFALAPRSADAQVAVLFAPWVDQSTAFERVLRAGGRVLSVNGPTAIARGDADDFLFNLRRQGAVLILDAQRIALLCGSARVLSNAQGAER